MNIVSLTLAIAAAGAQSVVAAQDLPSSAVVEFRTQADKLMVEALARIIAQSTSLFDTDQHNAVKNLIAIYERTNEFELQGRIVNILLVESLKNHTFNFQIPVMGIKSAPELYAKAKFPAVKLAVIKDLQDIAENSKTNGDVQGPAARALNNIATGGSRP